MVYRSIPCDICKLNTRWKTAIAYDGIGSLLCEVYMEQWEMAVDDQDSSAEASRVFDVIFLPNTNGCRRSLSGKWHRMEYS